MGIWRGWALLLVAAALASAQVIEFESGGLKYQTLTKNGVTIMFATLPVHVRDYAILQVAVQNGSPINWTIKAEDFVFERTDGAQFRASPAKEVVGRLIEKGSRNDVIKLVQTYEITLYGLSRFKSTNGYEQRRQAFFAEVQNTKIKAAAAASAVAFAPSKLKAGQSTDGAIFFQNGGRPLGAGRLTIQAAGETFRFEVAEHSHHTSP
jgi:hypothetical protein